MRYYINNFNRLATTRQLLSDLGRLGVGMADITIIDNASEYPPLLEWYRAECPCEVSMLRRNIGHLALEKLSNERTIKLSGFYCYTDSDINLPGVPDDFADVMMEALRRFGWSDGIQKVGPALRLDDIPDCYPRKEEVVKWEAQFWTKRMDYPVESYYANIDTTMAFYAPGVPARNCHSVRVAGGYEARHCPWHYGAVLPPDEEFLRTRAARPSGHWSK